MARQNETKGQTAPLGLFNIAYSDQFCKKKIPIKNEPKQIITSKTKQAPFSPIKRPEDGVPWAFRFPSETKGYFTSLHFP